MPKSKKQKSAKGFQDKKIKDALTSCDDRINAIEDHIKVFDCQIKLLEARLESFLCALDSIKILIDTPEEDLISLENYHEE